MIQRRRHPKDYGSLNVIPGAVIDTEIEAVNFVELTETEWRIVAYRTRSARRFGEEELDWWDYTFPEVPLWRNALKNGQVICVHVKRPSGLVLMGKLARRKN